MARQGFNVTIRSGSLNRGIARYIAKLPIQAERAINKAVKNTARDIKVIFKGTPFGFQDRTGALRGSIKGGIKSVKRNEIIGAVGAGDDSMGTDGKQTRKYVQFVEFGEFSQAGLTAFLRPGVIRDIPQIKKIIANEMKVGLIV